MCACVECRCVVSPQRASWASPVCPLITYGKFNATAFKTRFQVKIFSVSKCIISIPWFFNYGIIYHDSRFSFSSN